MYEAEVKFHLVKQRFNPAEGWAVTVHLDPMELCRGGSHPPDKQAAAAAALAGLKALGVEIGVDRHFGVDIRAQHPDAGRYLVEAKGRSSIQKELALYSAFGQLVTKIGTPPWQSRHALAFPDCPKWQRQAEKLPRWLLSTAKLEIWLVSERGIRDVGSGAA